MALSLSQLLAHDAPLLSPPLSPMPTFPLETEYPSPLQDFPPSPLHPSRALKACISLHDTQPDACASTQQLFQLASPSPPAKKIHKRSASPAPAPAKKVRAQVSSKDFVHPDVTGLNKREARLVKNRAAAFLSRQRKREEFENMEHRVSELETENARLLALSQNSQVSASPSALASEVEQLRAELAAVRDRERELSAQLASRSEPTVKLEASDSNVILSSPARSPNLPFPNKTGASLGLMVLLCALPSLLSMPMHSAPNTSFTIPPPLLPPSFDFNSYLPTDYDWPRSTPSSIMDLDPHYNLSDAASLTHRLELSSDLDPDHAGTFGNLDVSFDASPENGKIRVKIHNPSSSTSSRATSPGTTSSWDSDPSIKCDGAYAAPSPSMSSASSSSIPTSTLSPITSSDPFFGIGGSVNDLDFDLGPFGHSSHLGSLSPTGDSLTCSSLPSALVTKSSIRSCEQFTSAMATAGFGSYEHAKPDLQAQRQKRRVRITLKSMPQAGGAEGGEWEVQIC